MSAWEAMSDLADVIAEQLMVGREDQQSASREIAGAIQELIERVIEDKTGAC